MYHVGLKKRGIQLTKVFYIFFNLQGAENALSKKKKTINNPSRGTTPTHLTYTKIKIKNKNI
jgi:hypothetical protein